MSPLLLFYPAIVAIISRILPILGADQNATTMVIGRRVPGCPDLEYFQQQNAQLDTFNFTKIACLCGPGHQRYDEADSVEGTPKDDNESTTTTVSITCIYGSTMADLQRTIALAIEVDRKVERLMLDHMDFSGQHDPFSTIFPHLTHLKHLEIKKISGDLDINKIDDTNSSLTFDALEGIVIEECELGEVPVQLTMRTPNLKRLSLANNKINALRGTDFAGLTKLETLNTAGNLLSSAIEKDSLSRLVNLKNLEIGNHNFASEALLREIGQMGQLENLDLSQMDGVVSTEQFAHFRTTDRLKRLVLTGCNLKMLNSSSFLQFPALEWLDLRVNLIEKLEPGCFKGLKNLQFLSIAGNFIKEFPERLWNDVPELTNLDMGWNDFRKLTKNSFTGMGKKLERLNARNNEALREIEAETFSGLDQLRYLNLSGTNLGKIPANLFDQLRLTELELSASNLSSIAKNAFATSRHSMEWLSLARNELTSLDKTMFDEMAMLKVLDISENKWLCDEKMQKVTHKIDALYKNAVDTKREFELRNSENTVCDRPFARRGQSIFELLKVPPEELVYDERNDTTVAPPMSTTTIVPMDNENSTIDWKALTLLVGNNGDEHLNFTDQLLLLEEENKAEDARKPKYDINTVKYGHTIAKKEVNGWLSGVVVTLLVIATAFCIVIVARKRSDNDKREEPPQHQEQQTPKEDEDQSQNNATKNVRPAQKPKLHRSESERNCAISRF